MDEKQYERRKRGGMKAETKCNRVNPVVPFTYVIAMTVALTALIVTSPAFSAETAPDALVKSIATEMMAAARSDKALQAGDPRKIAELAETAVVPYFDFRRMTQSAMARNWRTATPGQQDQLTREFKTLLVSTYSKALVTYKDQAIEFRPVRAEPSAGEVTVRSEIKQPGQTPTVIDYDLAKSGDSWKIFDVKVGGASLVISYRDNFADEVRNNGVDGLISALANKNKQNEARYKTVKS
jgi:phospholipid transport system substrate-binding protein